MLENFKVDIFRLSNQELIGLFIFSLFFTVYELFISIKYRDLFFSVNAQKPEEKVSEATAFTYLHRFRSPKTLKKNMIILT